MLDGGPLDTPPQATASKAALPRAFGAYELIEEVARGGMGIVYRARQTQINRLVALKVMASGQFAAPDFVKRFRTEAEAVASLDHPHIVPIYEVGELEGQPFFSMKFVEGGSLAQRISNVQSPISNRETAELLAKLARAVHYAHQRGILHRDIKPGNVLLDAQGEPHLTDFGLAKLVEKDSTLTRTMAMLGTPSYMSPEQARGEAKQLTTAVDVYGLGAIFYELLSGQPPFAGGTTMETVRQVLEKEPRCPSAFKPGMDRDLETICLKCLAKETSGRYGSAEALANDLERWLRHEPILARPVAGLERFSKWVRRRPMAAALCAITLLAVTASVATLIRANVRIRAAQSNESVLRGQAERKTEESRQQLIRLNVSTGNRLLEEGDYFRALLWFTEALHLENGNAIHEDMHRRRFAAVLRQAPELAQLWFHDGFVNAVEFSPSGNRVISSSLDRSARVWDVTTGQPAVPPLRHGDEVWGARFTPDEKRLFTVDARGQLQFWDMTTGEPFSAPKATTAVFSDGVDFSPDGRWLAVPTKKGVQLYDANSDAVGPLLAATNGATAVRFNPDGSYLVAMRDRELQLWKLDSGQWVSKTVTHPAAVRGFNFSHDGHAVATFTLRSLFVWDLGGGQPARPPIQMSSDLFDCRFSPDDRWLATASWDGAARVFDAHSAKLVSDSLRHRAGVGHSIFSPDGRRLATASWDSTARLWDPRTGEPASPSLPHGGYLSSVNFSPDGTRLVTAGQDQTVRLWALRTNSAARLTLRHERLIAVVQFSPDGQRLLTCSHDNLAKVWEVRSGRLLISLRRLSQGITHGSFSPDGKQIVTACADGGARLWDAESGDELVPTMRHTKWLEHVAFSRDGQRLVTASRDGTARVWNVADGQPITPLLQHRGTVAYATFSPDGRRVLTASHDHTAQLWNAETGERVGATMNHVSEVAQANFSPDGRRIVTACTDRTQLPRAAQMWDAATGEALGPSLPHLDGVLCAQFSPDGRFIATGGEDRAAVIWDATTGARLTPSMPHSSYVVQATFSPDSRLLLTLSGPGSDHTARVWECATGESVTPPLKHSADPISGAWSPDGREIVIGASDGTASVWDVSPVSGSLATLQRQAEVLSAHRIEPNHGLMPLTAKEMRVRWDARTPGPTR
jgi:WD40 repeat protein/predicted Ser/Thr protein kinase